MRIGRCQVGRNGNITLHDCKGENKSRFRLLPDSNNTFDLDAYRQTLNIRVLVASFYVNRFISRYIVRLGMARGWLDLSKLLDRWWHDKLTKCNYFMGQFLVDLRDCPNTRRSYRFIVYFFSFRVSFPRWNLWLEIYARTYERWVVFVRISVRLWRK